MILNDKYIVFGYYLVCYFERDVLMFDKLLYGVVSYRDYLILWYILGKNWCKMFRFWFLYRSLEDFLCYI